MKKICSKCNKEKDISLFYKRTDRNSYRSYCKECCKILDDVYRKNNKDKRKNILKNYEIKNKDKREFIKER